MIEIQNKCFKGFKFVDLFAGIGGFHLALSSFGAECVFASEWDSNAAHVYEVNHGIKPAGDITKIKAEDIPAHDILCAGFPCQAFSIAGNQKGFADTRGTLFNEVVRIANHHKPLIVFMENVKNLEAHDGGRTFKVIRQAFLNIGYKFYHKVLNSKDFGVPQSRERTYMIAVRSDYALAEPISFPQCSFHKSLKSILFQGVPKGAHVKDPKRVYLYKATKTSRAGEIQRVGELISESGFLRGEQQGGRVYSANGVACTLRTSNDTHYLMDTGLIRTLNPRELARCQGFPDSFKISARPTIAAKQFGNSVTIDVLQFILTELSYSLGLET